LKIYIYSDHFLLQSYSNILNLQFIQHIFLQSLKLNYNIIKF